MKEANITEMVMAAMESAVRKVVEDHRRRGRPLAVWRDGKVVMLSPQEVMAVRETPPKYGGC